MGQGFDQRLVKHLRPPADPTIYDMRLNTGTPLPLNDYLG